ncbi:MAG: peroxidase family protein, partial [Nitrospira sp.]
MIDELRNFLFGPPGAGGQDLPSLNIQRGRDMGLPSYVQARLNFGLSPITSFSQITSNVTVQQQLQAIYGTVDKIDVWVGGLAEDHAPGAALGPLFQKIIAEQFMRTRDADRFWYENGQFSASELAQIRNTTFSTMLARNTGLTNLPANVFTTSPPPTGPAPAGTAATVAPTAVRSIDGSGNNLATPTLGQTGTDLKANFTVSYGDGISTPGGADRPGAREISNAVFAQTDSIPNTSGLTALAVFFGQILDHDLSLTATGITDTIKIHGDQATPANTYPFVAEKLPLMLGHPVYAGLNNVIARPIFLPAIDVANAATIDPTKDVMVKTTAIPGASVAVAAGTLEDREGNMFTGQLSITRVPSTLTPASLPPGLNPDLVVTIQPAEMVFTNPAPLSLPNTGGFAPGTIMDLWSINPLTGQFDNVGKGQVSQDGLVIETVNGGVRNSSWHFFSPPPAPNPPEDHSEECE